MSPNYSIDFYSAAIMAILFFATRRKASKRMSVYYFGYMVLSNMFFLFFHGLEKIVLSSSNPNIFEAKVIDFFSFCFNILFVAYFYFYVVSFLREYRGCKQKSYKNYIFWTTIGIILFYLFGLVFDWFYFLEDGVVQYHPLFVVEECAALLLLFPEFKIIFENRKKMAKTELFIWSSYICIPLVCRIFDILFNGDAMTISFTLVLLFMYISVNQETEMILHEKTVAFKQQEMEVQKTRQRVILSQIQPHFLYNVLNTISILCRKNPELAAKTTVDFATYLRMNLNSVDQSEPVAFSEEMKHTQIYLDLEKLRFGSALNIEYNINTTSFYLPVLSLQPLVENAVKHGICMKDEDGTLRISTFERDDHYEIVVEDNGVGFDTSKKMDDGETHIGIVNTRKRIEQMCNGTMTIESALGKGTKVTIKLPKSTNSSFRIVDTMNANILI